MISFDEDGLLTQATIDSNLEMRIYVKIMEKIVKEDQVDDGLGLNIHSYFIKKFGEKLLYKFKKSKLKLKGFDNVEK